MERIDLKRGLRHAARADRYATLYQGFSTVCFVVLLILALVLMPPRAVAQDKGGTSCYAVNLKRSLFWVTSGAWIDEERILVPDQHRKALLEITIDGSVTTALAGKIKGIDGNTHPFIQPSTIHAIDNGYLIEDEKQPRGIGDDEIYRVDRRLSAKSKTMLVKGRALGQDLTLDAIYDWSPVDSTGSRLLAFGDIRGPGPRDWKSAFLVLHEHGDSEIVHIIEDVDDPANELYLRTSSYITRVNDNGYILFLDNFAKIGEVTPGLPGIRYLPSFPVEFSRVESLYRDPSLRGEAHRQATAQFRKLEDSKMPMGIFGWRGHLYVFGKEKMNAQLDTAWKVMKLDPDTGATLGEFIAPTTAAHVVVVPNESGSLWALIEKGPVAGIGLRHAPYMNTSSVVLFPGAWLENSESSPLSGSSALPDCLSIN